MARQLFTSSTTPSGLDFHCYHLPKALVKISLWQISDPASEEEDPEFELRHELQIIADPAHRYYLHYHPKGTAHDAIKVEFSEEGFLSNIDVTVEDKTADIIDNLINVVKDIVAPVPRGIGMEPIELYQAIVDPFDESSVGQVVKNIKNVTGDFELSFKLLADDNAEKSGTPEGILCRPMTLCKIAYAVSGVVKEDLLKIPHPHTIHSLAIPIAPLVKNTAKVKFGAYGQPSNIEIEQPSWVEAASKLPSKFLKGLIAIPAEIIQLKVNYNSEKAAMKQTFQKKKQQSEEAKN